jgi:hypothetical protein
VFQDRVEIFTLENVESTNAADVVNDANTTNATNAANSVNTITATQQNVWRFDDESKLHFVSIAISDEAAYIADAGKRVIFMCDESGHVTKQFGAAPPQITLLQTSSQQKSNDKPETELPVFAGFAEVSPMFLRVAFSASGNVVHVTNPGKCRVETFDADGTWNTALSWGDVSSHFTGFCGTLNPVGLATLADGRIVTVERTINRVKVYETNGRISTVVASPKQLENFPTNKVEVTKLSPHRNANPDELTRPLCVSVVNEQIILFDPIFQLIRVFQSNNTVNNSTRITEEKPVEEEVENSVSEHE